MDYIQNFISIEDQTRAAMQQWASGIGVATAEYDGVRHGMTVSSFTSVSMDPPLVLVSMQKDTRTHDLVLSSGAFGVTLLAGDQQEISDRFAGRTVKDDHRFEGLEIFNLETGSPLLAGGLAVFDCRLKASFDANTTTVMFGEVVTALVSNRPEEVLEPLLYHNQGYRWLKEV